MEGENIVLRKFGSVWHSKGIIQEWRPGFWNLTNRRLFLWREEMLFETPLDRIEALMITVETHFRQGHVLVVHHCGKTDSIRVDDVAGFRDAIKIVSANNLCEIASIPGVVK